MESKNSSLALCGAGDSLFQSKNSPPLSHQIPLPPLHVDQPSIDSHGPPKSSPLRHGCSAEAHGPQPWRTALFPLEKPATHFKLRFIPPSARNEKVVGVCSKNAVEGELAILDLTLVGFFLGKRPSFSYVKSALLRQWKLRGNVEILQLIHGGYAFRFSDLGDRDSILDGDVVFIGGQPMFIRHWDRNLHTGGILGLRKVPLWVTLPGLPLHLWGEESLSAIGSVLGTPLYSDRTTALKSRIMFARICIEFAGDAPLLDSITIEDYQGLLYEQQVKYEWKPPQCVSCGIFVHVECSVFPKMVETRKASVTHPPLSKTPSEDLNELHERQRAEVDGVDTFSEKMNSGAENGVEDEWTVVRAKKKQPMGRGGPKWVQTRNPPIGVKEGVGISAPLMVSTPHWTSDVPDSREKVQIPAFSLFENQNSKTLDCPKEPLCPLSSFVQIGQKKGSNDSNATNGYKSDLVVPHAEKKTKPNGPPRADSSAGHTPFSSRLSIMARDMRLGKMGRGGAFLSKESSSIAGLKYGPSEAQSNSLLESGLGHSKTPLANGPSPENGKVYLSCPYGTHGPLEIFSGHDLNGPKRHGLDHLMRSLNGTDPMATKLCMDGPSEESLAKENSAQNQKLELHSMERGNSEETDRGEKSDEGPGTVRA